MVSQAKPLRTSDFDYSLPEHLIARHPLPQRTDSRLMHVRPGCNAHHRFAELPALLRSGDLLIVNDTLVVKARLYGQKDTGGRAELLVERVEGESPDGGHTALCQVRVSKPMKPGATLTVGTNVLRVVGREDMFYRLRSTRSWFDIMECHGEVPLPPYMARAAAIDDDMRYQTVYATAPGAVAAPTAGLHFDEALFERLADQGIRRASVTLHVGAGTFQPVRVDDPAAHRMHSEWFSIPEGTVDAIAQTRRAGGRVVAVGTTVVRTLESAVRGCDLIAGNGETALFITPGYRFQVVDALITNFHLPRSTLLMLVSAFAGTDAVRAAYAEAVAQQYRFFSYGDAMLLEKADV